MFSVYYAVGDLIDARDRERGAWFEGKIVQIVPDPNASKMKLLKSRRVKLSAEKNKEKFGNSKIKSKKLSSKNYKKKFGASQTKDINEEDMKKFYYTDFDNLLKSSSSLKTEYIEFLLYKVQLEGQNENEAVYFKLDEIRPRARRTLQIKDLKKDQMLMVNYNVDEPYEKGYWYDFLFKEMEESPDLILVGTVFVGPADSITQIEVKVPVHDKIFAIEKHTHVSNRTLEDYPAPEKRSLPLVCRSCRDVTDVPCKKCGCAVCYSKQTPENILLCDECNTAYHIGCLSPPLDKVPEDDWYCPSCKRDTSTVIAPGASRQKRKTPATVTKDWGRGMACVGKTKSCAMPSNHFGPIPGVEVGMRWRFRIQVSESGVHRPPVAGIHGRDKEGAFSIVLAGGYEDDVDRGEEFTYTGSGGRDLSGNKRTAEQSSDQLLTRQNKALARNCAVKEISEDGADAGENWRDGKPVRVVRSYKMLKHFPKYAPAEGIRYDGIYKVVKYYTEEGLSGFKVWKYLLRRDDPAPAPWEPNAKVFPMLYPDGYLEAEAEKVALKKKSSNTNKSLEQTKTKKRKIVLVTSSEDESDNARPEKFKVKFFPKKRKTNKEPPEIIIQNNPCVKEISVLIERMPLKTLLKYTSKNIGNVEVPAENITPQESQMASTKEKDWELSLEQVEMTSSDKNKNPESPIKGKQIVTEKKKNNTPPPSGSKKEEELYKEPLKEKAFKNINKDTSIDQLQNIQFFQRPIFGQDTFWEIEAKNNDPQKEKENLETLPDTDLLDLTSSETVSKENLETLPDTDLLDLTSSETVSKENLETLPDTDLLDLTSSETVSKENLETLPDTDLLDLTSSETDSKDAFLSDLAIPLSGDNNLIAMSDLTDGEMSPLNLSFTETNYQEYLFHEYDIPILSAPDPEVSEEY